ncbi:MarR family winged helix-turn-helix transcriptional regulator [Actinopolymorpha pittospori]|jgi:DNA-binding MarR family transcriptional regulator
MERQDLGALFARITRRLIDAETPLLAARDLKMWDYVVLSQLAQQEAPTQLALAQAIAYDKTRLIRLLDDLEGEGLLVREADPTDRRARIVRLTPAGERRLAQARADIRAMEEELLGELSDRERKTLLSVLQRLAGEPG